MVTTWYLAWKYSVKGKNNFKHLVKVLCNILGLLYDTWCFEFASSLYLFEVSYSCFNLVWIL